MRELPILFSSPMVRAILDGRKTQTRRVCKDMTKWVNHDCREVRTINSWPHHFMIGAQAPMERLRCPYGVPGDRLWVRETCRAEELLDGLDGVRYEADNAFLPILESQEAADRWLALNHYRRTSTGQRGLTVPSIHMPR